MNSYEQAIQYLSQFYKRTINRRNEHHLHIMNELLEHCSINLDEFQFVQIAGSCGKGSTTFLLSNMLHENGIVHGVFTGPHLAKYEERFRMNDGQINEEEFSQIVLDIADRLRSYPRFQEIGHMHVMVLIALFFFTNHHIQLVIFENGVGGASDPSNVFNPIVAILTEITLDHCHLLGSSIEEITQDKLHIVKKETQFVVCGMKNPAARTIAEEKEKEANQPFVFYERDYHSENVRTSVQSNQFDYKGMDLILNEISLPLLGEHQVQNTSNALAAIECLSQLGYDFAWEKVRKGIEHTAIPCRMEMVRHHGISFLFDGAHNSLELETLKKNIQTLNLDISKIIMTVSSNKDIRDMMQSIYLEGTEILLVPNPFIERRVSFSEITSQLDTLGHVNYRTFENIESSLQYLYQNAANINGTVLVTGSLYLVGRIKNIINQGDNYFA
ncbi:bifunctional folylpolyglutamate synthase/dihydrofolate synthase [Bacillus benzoevorans]